MDFGPAYIDSSECPMAEYFGNRRMGVGCVTVCRPRYKRSKTLSGLWYVLCFLSRMLHFVRSRYGAEGV